MAKKRSHKDDEKGSKKRKRAPSQLSDDDYYRKSGVFSLWLKKKKDIYFDQLPGDKARPLFSKVGDVLSLVHAMKY
eukprot:m.146829 g.146829  ORF g.146829 m.146829 type:complete len:76 (-) comp14977_c0_seq4:90-317(-)